MMRMLLYDIRCFNLIAIISLFRWRCNYGFLRREKWHRCSHVEINSNWSYLGIDSDGEMIEDRRTKGGKGGRGEV